ncbi:hypothetical protein QN277_011996 [Acacia crassicarpa]|uniref:F-box domain-containing protein n=1 Tax=Acacia crassicarpa TaxID=499986 RepID=A0AAE1MZI8_9FABA|nr:hypothetical protein QN277_011996 [Acacia crassicarpa]
MSGNIPSNEIASEKPYQNIISNGNIPFIPSDVVQQILLNLEARSLFQLIFVRRDWNSLITSPNFVLRYSDRAFNSKDQLFLFMRGIGSYSEINYSLRKNNCDFSLFRVLETPYFFFCRKNELVGTSNGLICLTDGARYSYILWNPTVRRYVHLSRPLNAEILSVGFGFDRRINDFKVVCLDVRDNIFEEEDSAWVFSYTTWSWKHVVGDILSDKNQLHAPHVFIHGVLHWIGSKVENRQRHYIRTFDLADEVFGQMLLPENIGTDLISNSLWATEDSIVVSLFTTSMVWSVWVMKQYGVYESWTKIITTDNHFPLEVLHICKNNDMIIKRIDGKIVRYNPTTSMTSVPVLRESGIVCVTPHVESLYLLEKSRDVKSY